MRFRLAAASLLLLSAACGKDGETYTVRTRLLAPSGMTDPLVGLQSVRLRVIQDGEIRGERVFEPDEAWKIPSGADPGGSLVLRIDGLDASGAVIRTGRTRELVPDDSKSRVFGVFFSAPGEFASPPSFPEALREDAETLPLPDGRAVTIGGSDGAGNALAAVSVYDPDAGEWTELAPLGEGRLSPGVAVLPDGLSLLVAGGVDSIGDDLDTTEIYRVPASGADPADAGETSIGPSLVTPWSGMQTGVLASGAVVLAGGFSNGTPLPAIFDPDSGSLYEIEGGTFAPAASVAATGDGRVAIVGGDTPETASRVDVVSEDSNGNVLLTSGVGALRVPRSAASAISVGAGRVLVTGGEVPTGGLSSGVEVVDLTGATATSALVERERVRRSYRPVERLGDGRVLLAGGSDTTGDPTTRAFLFDPATSHVDEVGSLPGPVSGRRYASSLPDGTALFVGGDDASDAYIFQPPVDPIDGGDRVTLSLSLVEGQRATGAVLDGAATIRVRIYDDTSAVQEFSAASGTSVDVPGFLPDDPVYVVAEAENTAGSVIAWGATSAPLDLDAQIAGSLTLLMGRVGEFVLAPQSLPSGHADGAALQLDDGRVAVACGAGGADQTDVFDPGTGATAALTTVIPTSRRDVRTAIVGGSLFVVGGPNGANTPTQAASRLDPSTGLWTAENGLGAPGRTKHVVIALGDGTILTHGNNATVLGATPGDVWNGMGWDPVLVPVKRSHHRAALLGDGDVLLVAGLNTSGPGTAVISASAETFDPGNQTFTPTNGSLATARRDHVAFGIPGGDAVVCGGLVGVGTTPPIATCERYSTAARTFSAAGSLSVARDDSATVTFPDGSTWILGGGTGMTGLTVAAVDVWSSGAIAPGPSMLVLRASPAAIALRDGRLVVAAGIDPNAATPELSSVEIHTPAAWTNPFGY